MSKQSGNVILGTLVGAAMGFAAGILFAPTSGKETRDILGEKADDFKDTINDAASKAIASLKEVKESAERALHKEENTAKNLKSDAKKLKDETLTDLKNA